MPILFVVKRSRTRLLSALQRHLQKPGLLAVLLDRRSGRDRRRGRAAETAPEDRRRYCRRQPLDLNALRTWTELGFLMRRIRVLPDAPASAPGRRAAKHRRARPAASR